MFSNVLRFATITQTSSVLLNNFKLKLGADFFSNRSKILLPERNVSHLELSGIDGKSHSVLNALFERFGLKVNKLTISNSKIDDFTLKEILRISVALKELTLCEVTIIKKLPTINPVRNESLKTLSVQYCDWEIFKFFMKTQLSSLKIKSYLDEGNRLNLINFLATQYRLKELVLLGTSLRCLFQQNDLNSHFSLETLHLDNAIGKNSDNVNWNVTAFLHQHEETLNNIDITGPHSEFISTYVLSNFENLHSFALDVRGLPKDEIFYEILENQAPNITLKNLKLCGFFFQRENVKKILLKFPAIKNLEINDWGNDSLADILDFISKNLVQLENLSITEISSNIKFQALKKLNVNYIRNSQKLVKFIVENNGIEMLKIGLVYISQIQKFVVDLKSLHNIKHLSIGGNKTALRAILNNLMLTRDLPEELKTLELLIIAGDDKLDVEKKAMKFNLPFDPIDLRMKYNVLV